MLVQRVRLSCGTSMSLFSSRNPRRKDLDFDFKVVLKIVLVVGMQEMSGNPHSVDVPACILFAHAQGVAPDLECKRVSVLFVG